MTHKRLLLVEDDLRFAGSVSKALTAAKPDWTIRHVGTIKDALAAATDPASASPDLAIVDLGLPDGSGLRIIESFASRSPALPAVAFTIFDDREHVLDAIRAGAVGYLLKEEPVRRVVEHLDEVLDGHMPVSSRIARYLFELGRKEEPDVQLTKREGDVLDCLMRGCSYAECASALDVGLGTIQTHVKNLYRKLDISSKAEAAAWATRYRRH